MSKALYILVSFLIVSFSVTTINDQLGRFLMFPFALGTVALFQVVIFCLLGRLKKTRVRWKLLSIVPSIIISGIIFLNFSTWASSRQVFELATGSKVPESVHNLVYAESGFTDFMAAFYCEISAEDLVDILKNSDFKLEDRLNDLPYTEFHWLSEFNLAPIRNPIRYHRSIGEVGNIYGGCTLITNQDNTRMYVNYVVD
ncbi:hypothetical protein P0Y35_18875 [Kiritimatiellaeota bacterium B1221]|nr:hypothetical protein [Kiritimatiellaeota bacterium B1221]